MARVLKGKVFSGTKLKINRNNVYFGTEQILDHSIEKKKKCNDMKIKKIHVSNISPNADTHVTGHQKPVKVARKDNH